MRPVKLEVQGLTSYREPVSVDFSDLDLVAITGPTGSGKSSLIDAITFALYGKVPRVGNKVKELISLGADRLKVTLYFNAGEGQYRIYRETARKGAGKPPQIERLDPTTDEWRAEDPDRVRNVNTYIEDLLLLDYEAFIRSVLLPQGEFQEFLCGDRDERRKVLDRLLRLAVYGVMQQKANALRSYHDGEATGIAERLETELADATPEALAAAVEELKHLEGRAEELTGFRSLLEQAVMAAERLSAARERERKELEEAATAAKKLEAAQATLATGEQDVAALEARIADARKKHAAIGYDPDRRATLTEARTYAQERDRIVRNMEEVTAKLNAAKKEASTIAEDSKVAKTRFEKAQATLQTLTEILDGMRRANLAVDLRSGLKVGDTCPVCGEPIARLPASTHGDLDRAASDVESARKEHQATLDAATDVERRATRLEDQLESLDTQRQSLEAESKRCHDDLARVTGNASVTTATLAEQLNSLEAARKEAADLATQIESLIQTRDDRSAGMASAKQEVATLGATVEAHQRNAADASREAAEAEGAVRALATNHGWEHVVSALERGPGVATILRNDLDGIRQEADSINQSIGSGRARIGQIEAQITLADRIREEEKSHRQEASLARDLASMLRTDQFPAFIRDSVMSTLAANGSAWLRKVSGERYDLKVDGQDFEVADLWNAGEERGVRTLSGGETFLASLALALALAELLPKMSGQNGEGALQSLFIDEGFSNLDEETLKTVSDAIEVLGQDRSRLIALVTHLPALAERMPARIVVHKTQTGSTVTVE